MQISPLSNQTARTSFRGNSAAMRDMNDSMKKFQELQYELDKSIEKFQETENYDKYKKSKLEIAATVLSTAVLTFIAGKSLSKKAVTILPSLVDKAGAATGYISKKTDSVISALSQKEGKGAKIATTVLGKVQQGVSFAAGHLGKTPEGKLTNAIGIATTAGYLNKFTKVDKNGENKEGDGIKDYKQKNANAHFALLSDMLDFVSETINILS